MDSHLHEIFTCTVTHNMAQNMSENLPSYLPDNRCCSATVCWEQQAQLKEM